jgi:hypothetical protein
MISNIDYTESNSPKYTCIKFILQAKYDYCIVFTIIIISLQSPVICIEIIIIIINIEK